MCEPNDMRPTEIAPNVWRVLDPTHQRWYYYDRATGETSWRPPPGVNDVPCPSPLADYRGGGRRREEEGGGRQHGRKAGDVGGGGCRGWGRMAGEDGSGRSQGPAGPFAQDLRAALQKAEAAQKNLECEISQAQSKVDELGKALPALRSQAQSAVQRECRLRACLRRLCFRCKRYPVLLALEPEPNVEEPDTAASVCKICGADLTVSDHMQQQSLRQLIETGFPPDQSGAFTQSQGAIRALLGAEPPPRLTPSPRTSQGQQRKQDAQQHWNNMRRDFQQQQQRVQSRQHVLQPEAQALDKMLLLAKDERDLVEQACTHAQDSFDQWSHHLQDLQHVLQQLKDVTRNAEAQALQTRLAQLGVAPGEPDSMCPVCMATKKEVAFGCGHQACATCAEQLQHCHSCRKRIDQKIKLF